ncbi:MAG: NAD(P)-dependent oxidoreductase [Aeriscardovia sp.]|nr:NAD(P)-dependent oxidoreductase [Aeriscardovia sp.]
MANPEFENIARSDGQRALKNVPNLDNLHDKRILVIGATGLVGSVLTYALAQIGHGATVVAVARGREELARRFDGVENVENKWLDVTNSVAMLPALDDIDVIVDCASITGAAVEDDPTSVMKTEFNGIDSVLSDIARFLKKEPVKPMVLYVSSASVYGSMEAGRRAQETETGMALLDDLQATAKRAAEALCLAYVRQYGLDVRVARLSRVYGPEFLSGDQREAACMLQCAAGEGVLGSWSMGGGRRTARTYVSDAVAGLLTVLTSGAAGGTYNVCDADACVTSSEFFAAISSQAGIDLPTVGECEGSDAEPDALDSSKLEALGWKPAIGVEKGVALSVAALRNLH